MKIQVVLKISSILLLSGVFLYLYTTYDPNANSIPFPKCPSYSLLGIICPGCGSQRAIHELLHFNIKAAFYYNPVLVITFPFILYMVIITLYNFIFEKQVRIKWLYSPFFTKFLLVFVIIYFVLRNLPFPIFKFLNPNI